MPKRRNPFGDNAPLQLKTHIGFKEVANGAMREEMMKEVYERTQSKLFSAVRRGRDQNANHMQCRMDPDPGCGEWGSRMQEDRQMVLDGAGHLVHPSFTSAPHLPPQHTGVAGEGDSTAHLGEVRCGQTGVPGTDMHCGQEVRCGQFTTWAHCDLQDGPALRHPSPPLPPRPRSGGQMCLDSNGRLTTMQSSAMDCDSDLQVTELGGTQGRSTKGGKGGGGLERWGFVSSKPADAAPGAQAASGRCQTCGHTAGGGRCQFCERGVCGRCCRQCHACTQLFCPLCSCLDYDTSVERAFCLNCVG